MNINIRLIQLLSLIVVLYSCGTDGFVTKIEPAKYTKIVSDSNQLNLKITKVINNRNIADSLLGFVYTGMINKKVPIYIEGTLCDFINQSFNKMILKDTSMTNFIPVIVILDNFSIGEKLEKTSSVTFLNSSIRFNYFIKSEMKSVPINNYLEFQSNLSFNDRIVKLIDSSMYLACSKFLSIINTSENTDLFKGENINYHDIDSITEDFSKGLSENKTPKKHRRLAIDLTLPFGPFQKYGFQINGLALYGMINNYYELGFGVSVTMIETSIGYKYSKFSNIGVPFNAKLFFDKSASGIYISSFLSLFFGWNSIMEPNLYVPNEYFPGFNIDLGIGYQFNEYISVSSGVSAFIPIGAQYTNEFGTYKLTLTFSPGYD